MATKNSLFVDTSGWAYLVDRHNPLHQEMRAVYQHALNQKHLPPTTILRKLDLSGFLVQVTKGSLWMTT